MTVRPAVLLAAVFCAGTAVMIVEMTAVRALQPWFGSTTWVWTNVIAVVLLALALGYAIGGRVADRRATPALLFSLLALAGLLVLCAAAARTAVSALLAPGEVMFEGMTSLLVRGSLLAAVVLFLPPALVLGAVAPIAVRLLADEGVGRATGRVLAASTTGSLIGTYLPTLWLVPRLGTRITLVAAAVVLLAPALAGLVLFARRWVLAAAALPIAILLAVLGGGGALRPAPVLGDGIRSEILREAETPYQYVVVRRDVHPDGTARRVLTINEGVRACHSYRIEGRVLTDGRYWDDHALLPALVDIPAGSELRACVIGAAGGVNITQWAHFWKGPYDLSVDAAELDPVVIELGRRYFDLPGPEADWLRTYAMDGRQMLAMLPASRTYHVIVIDAFANGPYPPFHLGTVEFFELCRRHLEPGGVLAMNVFSFRPESPHVAALENTLATAFERVTRIRQTWGSSYMLLARNGDDPVDLDRLDPTEIRRRHGARDGLSEWGDLLARAPWLREHATAVTPRSGEVVLTDDHAPLERLTDRFLAELEESVRRSLPDGGRR